MKLAVTGFGPFPGCDHNPAEAIAKEAARVISAEHPEIEVVCEILPVEFSGGREAIERLHREGADAVISIGVAMGRPVPCIERIGLNLQDSTVPDNAGVIKKNASVYHKAELALETSLNVHAVVDAARAAGQDVKVSTSAGTYVCNTVFYSALRTMCGKAVFIHVPSLYDVKCGAELARLSAGELLWPTAGDTVSHS